MNSRFRALLWRALTPFTAFFFWFGFAFYRFVQIKIAQASFQPRPDDIFIVTYPKSGTTLMQMIIYQLKSDGEMNIPHINRVCPYLELEFQQDGGRSLQALESPRCFKTHVTSDILQIETGRYIYILRDVRDVVISAYHHTRRMGGTDTLEQFTDGFLSTNEKTQRAILGAGVASWFDHLESWWPHRNRPNVLCLIYENMITDLEGTVRKVADFCGFQIREEDMPRILERCSLAYMKQHENKFDPRFHFFTQDTEGFIRQGKAGSGRDLSPRHKELFEQRLSKAAEKLGCRTGEPYREIGTALDKA
jgi:hypothetical protein